MLDLLNANDALLIKYSITLLKKNFSLNVYDIFDVNLLREFDFINKFFGAIKEFNSDYYVFVFYFLILKSIIKRFILF